MKDNGKVRNIQYAIIEEEAAGGELFYFLLNSGGLTE